MASKNPWGTPDKNKSNWAPPSKENKASLRKKADNVDNPKKTFTTTETFGDKLRKKF